VSVGVDSLGRVTTLEDGMRKLSLDLRSAFIGSQSVGHNLSKGEFREEELRRLLRPTSPGGSSCQAATVVNATGERSAQQDLIISDSHTSSPFLTSGAFGVHPLRRSSRRSEGEKQDRPFWDRLSVRNVASVKRSNRTHSGTSRGRRMPAWSWG